MVGNLIFVLMLCFTFRDVQFTFCFETVLCAVRPRFLPGQTTLVYNWAGKTRNLTCKVKAEPLPNIEWLRYGRVLRDNETFRTYVMSKDSNLQVRSVSLNCAVYLFSDFNVNVL